MDTFAPDRAAKGLCAQLPDRLRQARRAARLSQAALGAQVGVCASAVAQWELPAGTSPRVEHLAMVACICGVTFEWLATGRGPSTIDGLRPLPPPEQEPARDPVEQRLLSTFRRLRPRKRESFVRWLEGFV
jgi:transcriptional regulator with XRE-family HTH domain